MFLSSLTKMFDQHRERMESVMSKESLCAAYDTLAVENLDVISIDRDCALELREILVKQYESPIGSTRLRGHGWTTAHIKSHMLRFLQQKLQAASHILRAALEQPEDRAVLHDENDLLHHDDLHLQDEKVQDADEKVQNLEQQYNEEQLGFDLHALQTD